MEPNALGSTAGTLALILAAVLSLAVLFAQLRLFSINGSLKELAASERELRRSVDLELISEDCPHCGGKMVSGMAGCRHCGRDVQPTMAGAP